MTSQLVVQPFSSAILIVDDNPQNVQVLGKLLQESNYEIEFATNGKAALEWLITRQFDLILLDLNMPGMSGFEVCSKIRSNPDWINVPVIFLSAESDRESILKGFELGAQDYITKPFDGRELLARVRTHLALKDSLENLEKLNKSLEEKVLERTRQLKEVNDKLEATNLRLLDLDRAKAEFLNLISHQIRTPLNGIIGPLELLKEPASASEINDLVEILDISVRRLERFAVNALLITKLKTGRFEPGKDRIHFSNLIGEVIENAKEKFQSGNIHVERNDKIPGHFISGETEMIKNCISLILDNAITFSPLDSTIEINTYVENDAIICEIKDEGPGFGKGTIAKAFELFVTGDAYKDTSTGIGLPIAGMIMNAHGGSITIANNPEGGASVKLLFHNSIGITQPRMHNSIPKIVL
ncbi:MAG: response regulator [Bacteroidales bacterium]|nr:response regulator [Bacteroidales bacterium]